MDRLPENGGTLDPPKNVPAGLPVAFGSNVEVLVVPPKAPMAPGLPVKVAPIDPILPKLGRGGMLGGGLDPVLEVPRPIPAPVV